MGQDDTQQHCRLDEAIAHQIEQATPQSCSLAETGNTTIERVGESGHRAAQQRDENVSVEKEQSGDHTAAQGKDGKRMAPTPHRTSRRAIAVSTLSNQPGWLA